MQSRFKEPRSSPGLPAFGGNVCEITVAGADGCKHSGRWRAAEARTAKGVQYGGKKSWPTLFSLATVSLFCGE